MRIFKQSVARRSVRIVSTLTLAACGRLHHATVAAKPFCTPPWEGAVRAPTTWRILGTTKPDSAVAFEAAARALSGTWDMLTVTTEGEDGARPEHWKLRLVVADSASQNPCFIPGCRRTGVRIVAIGTPLGSTFDSVSVTRATNGSDRIVARYDRNTDHVTLHFNPGLLDGGTFYALTEVSDSTIAGRWIDGSYLLFSVRRGDVTTLEHPQGFFCGRKVRRDLARE
jgi:hypothetical protein